MSVLVPSEDALPLAAGPDSFFAAARFKLDMKVPELSCEWPDLSVLVI